MHSLLLDFLKVTEEAAISAIPWIGMEIKLQLMERYKYDETAFKSNDDAWNNCYW